MNGNKAWWTSKTEWAMIVGFVVVLLINILPMVGVNSVAAGQAVQAEQNTIVENILSVTTGLGFLLGFIFRLVAKKQLKK